VRTDETLASARVRFPSVPPEFTGRHQVVMLSQLAKSGQDEGRETKHGLRNAPGTPQNAKTPATENFPSTCCFHLQQRAESLRTRFTTADGDPAAMKSSEDLPETTRAELPREVLELGRRISALPPAAAKDVEAAYVQVVDCVHRRRRLLNLVQEALAELRLDIKYLMFDLDVTRRERDQLKAQLDELERQDEGF
jgi:hypothetical protein